MLLPLSNPNPAVTDVAPSFYFIILFKGHQTTLMTSGAKLACYDSKITHQHTI